MSFHSDELTAQARAGVETRSAGIRDFMPEHHRTFFAALPHLFVATIDAGGWPLATLLEGEPGFVSSPDPKTLCVRSLPAPDDPAYGMIRKGQEVGLLGIDLMTRRRNRANGVVSELDADAFTAAVRQSFGNCPQYIQRRSLSRAEAAKGEVRSLESLDEDARKLISRNIAANLARSFYPEPWIDRHGRLKGNLLALMDLLRGTASPARILQL